LLAGLALPFILPRPLLPAWAVGMLLLFADGWTSRRLAPLAYVGVFPLVSLPVMAMAPGMFARYLVPILPFAAILAAVGAERLAMWAVTAEPLQGLASSRRQLLESALAVALVGALVLSLPRYSVPALHRERDHDQRQAGLWLWERDPSADKRILSVLSQVPYYAGGIHVPMPDGTPEQVAAYAQEQGVDYAVISPRKLGSRPGLASWRSGETVPSDWERIYQDEDAAGGTLFLYRLP
jgi:hypothetical protein